MALLLYLHAIVGMDHVTSVADNSHVLLDSQKHSCRECSYKATLISLRHRMSSQVTESCPLQEYVTVKVRQDHRCQLVVW